MRPPPSRKKKSNEEISGDKSNEKKSSKKGSGGSWFAKKKISERPVGSNGSVTTFQTIPCSTMSGGKKETEMTPEAKMELFRMVGKTLTEFPWYHGLMPRNECEQLLKADGDFLVRRTTMKQVSVYCISANCGGTVKHIPLEYKKGQWVLFTDQTGTLNELIDMLTKEARPIGPTGCILKCAIPRPDYYILHENIQVDKKIGCGAFGEVFTGLLRTKDKSEIKVAIKIIKGQVKKDQVAEFIKEAKLMRRFCHPNTVMLYGIAPQEEPIMIVLELAAGGSLKSFFKKEPDCGEEQLINFVKDACRGMCYLSLSQVIHRDLAARNCLLGERNELKISDFGLSVADQTELKLTKLKSVPIRWLAPETLKEGVFSTKTDVWSFGVLTWEIFSKCKSDPFPNETNAQAKVKILGDSAPMEAPSDAPSIAKQVMEMCFVKDPQKRADFVGLLKLLSPDEKPPTKAEIL